MSLQWNSNKCNPPTPADNNDDVIRDVLAFESMAVGMPYITSDNWRVFYARLHAAELLIGPFTMGKDRSYITPKEVKRWIGLETNASVKSETQFKKTLMSWVKNFESISEEIE